MLIFRKCEFMQIPTFTYIFKISTIIYSNSIFSFKKSHEIYFIETITVNICTYYIVSDFCILIQSTKNRLTFAKDFLVNV